LSRPGTLINLVHCTADYGYDLIIGVAFGDIVEGSVLDGLHAVGNIAMGCE
jgi:hypothetical protein